jgi:hypothetical protein
MRSFKRNIYRLSTQDAYDCDILSGTAVEKVASFLYLRTANTYNTSGEACAQGVGPACYLPQPAVYTGQTIYTDEDLQTKFNGNNKWIKLLENGTSNITPVQVNRLGKVLATGTCSS